MCSQVSDIPPVNLTPSPPRHYENLRPIFSSSKKASWPTTVSFDNDRLPAGNGKGLPSELQDSGKNVVWFCHKCNDGPLDVDVIPACPNCQHRRCKYCKVKTIGR